MSETRQTPPLPAPQPTTQNQEEAPSTPTDDDGGETVVGQGGKTPQSRQVPDDLLK